MISFLAKYYKKEDGIMRIALTSKEVSSNNIGKNIETIIATMSEAKELGAEIVFFGEAFLQSPDAIKGDIEFDKRMAVSVYSEPINRICRESRKLNIDVMLGYYEKDRERLSSSFIIIERGEVIYDYKRLTNGWKKNQKLDKHYYDGQVIEVIEYRHKRCMIALSDDLVSLPALYNRNEEIIFWPSYIEGSIEDTKKKFNNEYVELSANFNLDILIVNTISSGKSYGGAYRYKNGDIIDYIEPGKDGIVIANVEY